MNLSFTLSLFKGGKIPMSEKYIRQGSGSKSVAIDNRAQIARTRLLLLLSLLFSGSLALVLDILFHH